MSEEQSTPIHRPIRSYVRRQGRMTESQDRAFEQLWPTYGLEPSDEPLDLTAVFGRQGPLILEIGFGMGDALADMAHTHPNTNYIGIEVHRPGVGRLFDRLDNEETGNVRVFCHDAVEILKQQIPDASLDRVLLFFPDPWHKKKHNKRRIIRPEFVQMIRVKLKPGGVFHMATDWQDYAEWMMGAMSDADGFENQAGHEQYSEKPDYRPETKFERRGLRLGHGIWDLLFERVS